MNLRRYIQKYQTDEGYQPELMPTPTNAAPGSATKVEILRQRIADGEELFHPDDTRFVDSDPVTIKEIMDKYMGLVSRQVRKEAKQADSLVNSMHFQKGQRYANPKAPR